jgi:hypothetical protein
VISWRSSLAQGGFAALPVGVSAEGIPEADRQALCSPSSAATESSGAVELGGVAVLPGNGVVAQPTPSGRGMAEGNGCGFSHPCVCLRLHQCQARACSPRRARAAGGGQLQTLG